MRSADSLLGQMIVLCSRKRVKQLRNITCFVSFPPILNPQCSAGSARHKEVHLLRRQIHHMRGYLVPRHKHEGRQPALIAKAGPAFGPGRLVFVIFPARYTETATVNGDQGPIWQIKMRLCMEILFCS